MKEISSNQNHDRLNHDVYKSFILNVLASINTLAIYWIVPVVLFGLWWIAANNGWMPAQILPTPQQTWHSFLQMSSQDLWWHLAISLKRLALGLCSGLVAGVVIGVLLGYSRNFEQYVSAIFYALAIVPTLAWLPLLMIWLGIEDALKVFIIFKASLIPIAIHVQAGVRDIQPKLREMAEILKFSQQALIFKLILPASLPYFFTGLRLAIAASWTSLIAVELLASSEGIGYLMVTGRQLFQLDIVFVCIILIAAVGIVLDTTLQWLEAKTVFWPHAVISAHHQDNHYKKSSLKPWLIPVLLLSLWFFSSQFHWISASVLPSPVLVSQALVHGLQDGSLSNAMHFSLYRALLGLMIGGSIGVITGLILGLFKPLELMFAPTLNILRLIAIFAWIPLITAWFGLGDSSKLVFISLATFFPLFIATWKGSAMVSTQLTEASDILRLSIVQRLELLILPSIAPAIFAGLRLALLYSWMASFGAEYLMGSGTGIGSYMIAAQQNFEMNRVIAATLLVAITGGLLAWLGKVIESYATAWRGNRT
ncbi:ABC transporter permease [Acinetobacter ihumii]|uniref:ABC transporter permease n=1 Tax=Acinetobacter ihumii TaxID=2483802 RepID=UPI0010302777|nr:ABC transporter permease [Acinetobacter ihumii]